MSSKRVEKKEQLQKLLDQTNENIARVAEELGIQIVRARRNGRISNCWKNREDVKRLVRELELGLQRSMEIEVAIAYWDREEGWRPMLTFSPRQPLCEDLLQLAKL